MRRSTMCERTTSTSGSLDTFLPVIHTCIEIGFKACIHTCWSIFYVWSLIVSFRQDKRAHNLVRNHPDIEGMQVAHSTHSKTEHIIHTYIHYDLFISYERESNEVLECELQPYIHRHISE